MEGVGPGSPTFQGYTAYYHKPNGQWAYKAAGTGMVPGDIPGAPAELFQ